MENDWVVVVDRIIGDLESAIEHYNKGIKMEWVCDDREEGSGVPIEIFLKNLIKSTKELRSVTNFNHEIYEKVNESVTIIIFLRYSFSKVAVKNQSERVKVLAELVRSETELIQLRDIAKKKIFA